MQINHIIKRDFTTVPFQLSKITNAILKAMTALEHGSLEDAERVSQLVETSLLKHKENDPNYIPTVETVQDAVENALMESHFLDVAKAYILYRDEQARKRKTNIFEKRINLKPYEYPQLYEYVPAIRHSYWIHTEFNFTSDIQDFKAGLNEVERSAIKNTMLAISQIEVAVKSFWGDIYHRMPKPEIGSVGATFAESEVRHHDAYSHLLEILGLNNEFKTLKKKPVIMKRVQYLETALKNAKSEDNQEYASKQEALEHTSSQPFESLSYMVDERGKVPFHVLSAKHRRLEMERRWNKDDISKQDHNVFAIRRVRDTFENKEIREDFDIYDSTKPIKRTWR